MSDTRRADTQLARQAQEQDLKLVCLIGQKESGMQEILEYAMRTLSDEYEVITGCGDIAHFQNDKSDLQSLMCQDKMELSDDILIDEIYGALEKVRKMKKIAILYDYPATRAQAELLATEIYYGDYFLEKVIVLRDPSNKDGRYDRTEAEILSLLAGESGTSVSEISEKSRFCAKRRLNAILTEIADV